MVQKDVYHNLDVLACGPIPPNPSELLGSKRMQDLLDEVKDKYDYILLDMPPILAVTDAVVMASKVDGVVLIIRSGFVSPEEAKEAKRDSSRAEPTSLASSSTLSPRPDTMATAMDITITTTIMTM